MQEHASPLDAETRTGFNAKMFHSAPITLTAPRARTVVETRERVRELGYAVDQLTGRWLLMGRGVPEDKDKVGAASRRRSTCVVSPGVDEASA